MSVDIYVLFFYSRKVYTVIVNKLSRTQCQKHYYLKGM